MRAKLAPPNGSRTRSAKLAWFTGFLPANDPLYAYAVVYEGQPGEVVSGGKKAAPIVHEVFTNIMKGGSPDEPLVILAQNKDAPKAVPITEEDEEVDGGGGSRNGPGRMRATGATCLMFPRLSKSRNAGALPDFFNVSSAGKIWPFQIQVRNSGGFRRKLWPAKDQSIHLDLSAGQT